MVNRQAFDPTRPRHGRHILSDTDLNLEFLGGGHVASVMESDFLLFPGSWLDDNVGSGTGSCGVISDNHDLPRGFD